MDHTVVHFDIPANDPKKLGQFYKKVFGWETSKFPGPMEYWTLKTSEKKGAVGGGVMKRQDAHQSVTNYITVDSVDEFTKKAEKAGAKTVMPKMHIPTVGHIAVCVDPEGNPFGLWEAEKPSRQRRPKSAIAARPTTQPKARRRAT